MSSSERRQSGVLPRTCADAALQLEGYGYQPPPGLTKPVS